MSPWPCGREMEIVGAVLAGSGTLPPYPCRNSLVVKSAARSRRPIGAVAITPIAPDLRPDQLDRDHCPFRHSSLARSDAATREHVPDLSLACPEPKAVCASFAVVHFGIARRRERTHQKPGEAVNRLWARRSARSMEPSRPYITHRPPSHFFSRLFYFFSRYCPFFSIAWTPFGQPHTSTASRSCQLESSLSRSTASQFAPALS